MREHDELRRIECSRMGTPGSFSLANVATKSIITIIIEEEGEEGDETEKKQRGNRKRERERITREETAKEDKKR